MSAVTRVEVEVRENGEHMGDYTRDVKPLCEALVALASGDTDTQESK
jgi:hypothetical protein